MRYLAAAGLAALGLCALPVAAGTWTGEVALVSDYVDRGISNSDGKPAFQAGLGHGFDNGFHVGAWASTADFDDGETNAEVNLFAAQAFALGPLEAELSATWIGYPGVPADFDANLWEFALTLGHPIGDSGRLGVVTIYTPNNAGHAGNAVYAAIEGEWSPIDSWTLSAHVGRQWNDRPDRAGPSYQDWGVALVRAYGPVNLSLTFADSDLHAADCPGPCGARLVAGVALGF